MKICLYVGTRPNLIKTPILIEAGRLYNHEMVLVDTLQHYDRTMRDIFYHEFNLPAASEHIPLDSDLVMVIGDTNSTVNGALEACAMGIKVAHVEAGLRCWNKKLPEEVNRIIVDGLADYLFCPTPQAYSNVIELNPMETYFTGDILYDMFLKYRPEERSTNDPFVLFTMHRQENTQDKERVIAWLLKASQFGRVYFPVHPKTRELLAHEPPPGDCIMMDPVNYRTMLGLINDAEMVFTDSGGVQREAYWSDTPCTLMREETEWKECRESRDLLEANFGHGNAAGTIMEVLSRVE